MNRSCMRRLVLSGAGVLSLLGLSSSTSAEAPPVPASRPAEADPLRPDDLALVFNAGVPESRKLAEYYAAKRGVSPDRLIGVRLPERETLDRMQYVSVAREIRTALRAAGLDERIRCLVTFYGMPIRVGALQPGNYQKTLARQLEIDLENVAAQLDARTSATEALAKPTGTSGPAKAPTTGTTVNVKRAAERFAAAKAAVAARLPAISDDRHRAEVVQRFFDLLEDVEGTAGLLAQIRARPGEGHPSAVRRLDAMRALVQEQERRIPEWLSLPPDSRERVEARATIRKVWGLLGAARTLQDDHDALLGRETGAAFDSELTLLWWDEYPLYRWRANPLAWRVRCVPSLRQTVPARDWQRRTLMVARLDAPTPAIVRRMIDDAGQAERTGLAGTFYIDARGLARDNSYGVYDQNLRDLAALLTARTAWPVRLDDRAEVFGAGTGPDAALYCGWYSLRKYVPAFRFVPGAVGYHIASAEAVSLRGIGEQGWCKRMLEEGIAATLGPVDEPYLHAFPLPTDFFALLLSGRFTLAECYAFTNNFGSWMLMLLGDPLYRPFAGRPVLRLEDALDASVIPEAYRRPDSRPTTDAMSR